MGDTRLEPLVLSDAEQRILQGWAMRRKTAQGLALRARIVLACAEGHGNTAVAARLGVSRATVGKWRARFLARRLDGLGDEPRPGVPRTISDAQVEEVVVRTLEEVPEGATHWSKRELAKRVGISPTSVYRPVDRTNGPFLVDLSRPGPLVGQASSSLITRMEAGWIRTRRLDSVVCRGWLFPGLGRCAGPVIRCCHGWWLMSSADGSTRSMTSLSICWPAATALPRAGPTPMTCCGGFGSWRRSMLRGSGRSVVRCAISSCGCAPAPIRRGTGGGVMRRRRGR